MKGEASERVCGDGWLCPACSLPAHELTQEPGCGAPLAPPPIEDNDGADWKGGFDRASWMGRYAEHVMRFGGMQPYEAECWALNAWEASPDDADPDDTAGDDLAYSAED